ncbi:neurotrimin-like [Daphnia pulex]|uniref:neurotrimin-like n=1 Tax=Daphnia pulex TaxID=6669 RepID=UPI001EDCA88F|nr:neurotrimin-like [Daphnia pulex]
MAVVLLAIILNLLTAVTADGQSYSGSSMFVGQMPNVTVSTGREAVFTCVIDNVDKFKVAFLRVDTQTILAIDETVITRSARVTVRHSIDKDESLSSGQRKTWQLSLKEVTPADAGGYMCQLNNFEPMVSQVAYLHVTVPPDILVNESSSDMTMKEGDNTTLRCSAIGYPQPNVTWRREDYQPININQSAGVVEGSVLNLVNVHRQQMAAYLCIASNGIPPPVSKRILLRIEFAPAVTSHQVQVFQRLGDALKLHCQCQSWPQGYTSWTFESNRLPPERAVIDYRPQAVGLVVTDMYLTIAEMLPQDKGNYTCHCSNIHGTANWSISVEGIALDPVQQRRMAHSSWSGEHEEEQDEQEDEEMEGIEDEEEEEEFSHPATTTTTALSRRQTERVQLERVSTTEATTRKTIEANHQWTQEPTKRNNNGAFPQQQEESEQQQQQHKKKKASSGVPTSLTSKASAASQGISSMSSSHHLFLLLFFISILIDNHPPAT